MLCWKRFLFRLGGWAGWDVWMFGCLEVGRLGCLEVDGVMSRRLQGSVMGKDCRSTMHCGPTDPRYIARIAHCTQEQDLGFRLGNGFFHTSLRGCSGQAGSA